MVIHQIAESIDTQLKYLQNVRTLVAEMLKLGDKVIISVSRNIFSEVGDFIEEACFESCGICLGKVSRYKALLGVGGELYLFINPKAEQKPQRFPDIYLDVFHKFHGAYPVKYGFGYFQKAVPG